MIADVAYIPFVHPLNIFFDWWYLLLLPLSFGISVIYKAMRMARPEGYWRQVITMTVQIVIAMIALAVLLGLFVQLVIPAMVLGE
jgi:hypothetical protein